MKVFLFLLSVGIGKPVPQMPGQWQPGVGGSPWQGCPQGQTWQNGRCVSQGWQGCPQGQTWQNGTCSPQCPSGQHWDQWQRRCVMNFNGNNWQQNGNQNCGFGQIWNGSTCVQAPRCQTGFVASPTGCVRQSIQFGQGNQGWQGVTGPGSPTVVSQINVDPSTAAKEQEIYFILGWQPYRSGFNVDSHVRAVVRYLDRKNVILNTQRGIVDQVLQQVINLSQYFGQSQLDNWKKQVIAQAQQQLNNNGYSNNNQSVKFHSNARHALGLTLAINTRNSRQQIVNALNNVYNYINRHPVGQLNVTHPLDSLIQQILNLRQYMNWNPQGGQDPLINNLIQLQTAATNQGYSPIVADD